MRYNQFKVVEGEIQKDGMTIGYKVAWVRDVPRDTVQIDGIEDAWAIDKDCEEIQGYYQEHRDELDDLIIADAYKHEPDGWEQPSWTDWQEAMAEEAM